MAMTNDVFREIKNAALDLQGSDYQTFHEPLGRLVRLLRHESLKPTNEKLAEGCDLQEFLRTSKATQGGMIGSARLVWPNDDREVLGLKLLLVLSFGDDANSIMDIAQYFFSSRGDYSRELQKIVSGLIIPFVRDYQKYAEGLRETNLSVVRSGARRVFIVHGHEEAPREKVARFLSQINFEPIILHEQANRGRTVIQKFLETPDIGFAVILLTPDDEGAAKGSSPRSRARQNVILEWGYFLGVLGPHNVCALRSSELELPSDMNGIVWEDIDPAGAWKQKLGRELGAAGYEIDWNKVMAT